MTSRCAHLHRKTLVLGFELVDLLPHDVQLFLGELELVLEVVLSLERVLQLVHDLRDVAARGGTVGRLRGRDVMLLRLKY